MPPRHRLIHSFEDSALHNSRHYCVLVFAFTREACSFQFNVSSVLSRPCGSRNSAIGTATVPGKKDKNPEKPRIRTLSSPKTRPPGIVVNVEEPVIPDGSFFPNLSRPTHLRASHFVGLRTGCVPYLFITFWYLGAVVLTAHHLLACAPLSRVTHAYPTHTP